MPRELIPSTVEAAAQVRAGGSPGAVCANCGAPLAGPYCHACGQPVKGMIRQLSSVLADFADSVLNLDSRLLRTIAPLLLRPGWLTLEYFAGRRVRYVTPFRLFFFLCIIAIFAIQLTVQANGGFDVDIDARDIGAATSVPDLQRRTNATIARIELDETDAAERARAIERARQHAARRMEWIQQRDAAIAAGQAPPPDPNARFFRIDGQIWDPVSHPLVVGWLPNFANRELNEAIGHLRANLMLVAHNPARLINNIFPVLPQTLFVMLPLFALLLKITYIFKRRLYMEHLIVALHSHAFIFLALLLLALTQGLLAWVRAPAATAALNFAGTVLWIWLPLYLLLMQKRVYAQGWVMTLFKYAFVGCCYMVLLGFAVAAAVVISLVSG